MPRSEHCKNNQLRIGAVNYLNTKPLVHGLEQLLPDSQIVYDFPSRLADDLASGQLDIGLIPSIELIGRPDWNIVSDACIGCRGPVLSVKLMFRVPPAEVCTLALDEGSRTSAVLAQILLQDIHGIRPRTESLPIGCGPESTNADAVLVIGDRAIRSDDSAFVEVWDLGDRWNRWAELPFVFAMWVARAGVDASQAELVLATARDQGCCHLPEIAEQQSVAMDLPRDMVLDYLQTNLHFQLGVDERRGLKHFFDRADQLGITTGRVQVPEVIGVPRK